MAILLSEQSMKIPSTPLNQWMHYREKLQQQFPQQTIDLTILNTANPILKQQIFYYGYQVGLRNKEEYLQFRMKTYQQQFDMIHIQEKIISKEEREKLIKIIGFRNIIAHQYAEISIEVLYRILVKDIDDLKPIANRLTTYAGV
ncbi:Protein of unknown function DUF86 [Tindallia magadiensis]|uniref:DUF86 domain-containing protein n=2 Tax=Tindallia magadiensis TaxID=69895 RepID=A0A1I3D2V4_9FIRM|nr:Protein of unknown function DUF86 [Tindallia magadiensis]